MEMPLKCDGNAALAHGPNSQAQLTFLSHTTFTTYTAALRDFRFRGGLAAALPKTEHGKPQ
jgi:hypothetical protein